MKKEIEDWTDMFVITEPRKRDTVEISRAEYEELKRAKETVDKINKLYNKFMRGEI